MTIALRAIVAAGNIARGPYSIAFNTGYADHGNVALVEDNWVFTCACKLIAGTNLILFETNSNNRCYVTGSQVVLITQGTTVSFTLPGGFNRTLYHKYKLERNIATGRVTLSIDDVVITTPATTVLSRIDLRYLCRLGSTAQAAEYYEYSLGVGNNPPLYSYFPCENDTSPVPNLGSAGIKDMNLFGTFTFNKVE